MAEAGTSTRRVESGVSGADIVGYAQQQLGDRYNFGATGPDQWDCSALVQHAYRQAGIQLPRVTHDQVKAPGIQVITADELQPGDLVFFDFGLGRDSHVGIFAGDLGNGPVTIEARGSSKTGLPGVSYRAWNSYAQAHATAFRRVPGVTGYGGSSKLATTPTTSIPDPGEIVDWVTGKVVGAGSAVGGAAVDPLGALNRIADAAFSVGKAAGSWVGLAEKVTDMFLYPRRYVLKGFLFFGGIIFILIGVYNLSRAAKDA